MTVEVKDNPMREPPAACSPSAGPSRSSRRWPTPVAIIGLSQLAEKADLPLATIHRLVRTLVDLGYVRQEASRQYSLGPRLMRLADTSSKRIGTWARPGHERRGRQAR